MVVKSSLLVGSGKCQLYVSCEKQQGEARNTGLIGYGQVNIVRFILNHKRNSTIFSIINVRIFSNRYSKDSYPGEIPFDFRLPQTIHKEGCCLVLQPMVCPGATG